MEWRTKFVNIIYKYRDKDNPNDSIKRQIENFSCAICSLHFDKSEIWHITKNPCLKFGVLPTKNMPTKSFQSLPAPERRMLIRYQEEPKFLYKELDQIQKAFLSLKNKHKWAILPSNSFELVLGKFDIATLPKYVLTITMEDKIPKFALQLYSKFLPVDKIPDFKGKTILAFLIEIENKIDTCQGFISVPDLDKDKWKIRVQIDENKQIVYCYHSNFCNFCACGNANGKRNLSSQLSLILI